ncbi:hypothetical protein Ping_1938 [Psychromonas ingrahamii 37]|uniref:SMODS and SLOG-associating 2TM effector domain-containing protein n=1 Tax=Psychromonas ingrahamii (strain DSM 17664 / CCUG 51855 / 37) TaxID=357804 RepID=A1SW43_PSYIN|nr:SLATT domain-containing protein [Psychromonas ingrahamii]ABM03708.1 hypothetical protein Ping_1938 [Psychromonas ingrahamii 37]
MRPEDPVRLQTFREATQGLLWDDQHAAESLSQLFCAVDDLAAAEVTYYYRRRTTRAWISGISRFAAWVSGTIGLLLPLLATTANPEFKSLAQYGYVFIAIAASCLTANSLFGGTEGHIRFVTTQLELEKLITDARISWCHYLESRGGDSEDLDAGFLLIQDYTSELYTTTLSETGRWGETMIKELTRFQKSIESRKK